MLDGIAAENFNNNSNKFENNFVDNAIPKQRCRSKMPRFLVQQHNCTTAFSTHKYGKDRF
jgi:hypothetical protein